MSPKASYCCNAKACEDYYVNQAGNGMPFFRRSPTTER